MVSTEFIINRIKTWKDKYYSLKLKYAFDNRSQEHIIQIPRGKVYESKEFQNELMQLWRDFEKNYKKEVLIITPPDDPKGDNDNSDLPNILFEF